MRCGTKMFVVEYEEKDQKYSKDVPARSPIKARKIVRNMVGEDARILSCRMSEQKTNH